jgi:hypothetical protein
MRALVVVALLASGSPAHGASSRRVVWTVPWGWLDGTVPIGATDLPTNGRLSVIGVQGGEEFVRSLAERSPVFVGGGTSVPIDIAEYPHVGDGYTEAVLVPRRPLLPRTLYRLALEPGARPSAAERAAIEVLEERSYLTGPGPDGTLPEWTGEPRVGGQDRVRTLEGYERWVSVVLPSSSPIPFARVTLVCPSGAMQETRCYPASEHTARIRGDGCSTGAAAAIIELLDRDGRVSAPRRVALPAPSWSGSTPSWPVGVLAFVLAPFVAGYTGGRLLLRRRHR